MKMGMFLLMIVLTVHAAALQAAHGARNATITLLQSAVAKGAVCLDGSPPGYAFRQGYGEGANKWIVYLQGGGWCESPTDCFNRSTTRLGSSIQFMSFYHNNKFFGGMFDDDVTLNPDFYNWNIYYILYCDGSSFMSNVEELDPVYNISYRGGRIFDAMMEEFTLNLGMGNANSAILSGTSAGGLATILHCDKFGALFPSETTNVKCVSDSGFFIHGEDFIGADWREARFFNVLSTHGFANLLPTSCTAKLSPTLCLFPENLIQDLQTPLFLIESAFDSFQIAQNVFSPNVVNRDLGWYGCTKNLISCNWSDIKIMKDFRTTFISTLKNSSNGGSPKIGFYVHSCYQHGHLELKANWMCSSLIGITLANKTIGEAVSEWYFNGTSFREIDTLNDVPRLCSTNLSMPDFDAKCSNALHARSSLVINQP